MDAEELRMYKKRLQERYPDEYNEESEADFLDRYFGDMDSEMQKYKDAETNLNSIFEGEPELASFIADLNAGAPVKATMIRYFGEDMLEPTDGEDDYEANLAARDERRNKAKMLAELQDEIAQNEEGTLAAIKEYADENDVNYEELVALIDGLFTDVLHKKLTPERISGLHKMLTYDKDIEQAKAAGEIEGRNANIDAQKAKAQEQAMGDGLPQGGGSGSSTTQTEKPQRVGIKGAFGQIRENQKQKL